MVRETRHLWVGNLPDNIREDRIREHFKRYGRVQSVKLLPRSTKEETAEGTMACTVAFMDIKSASKAHNTEHKVDDRTLTTEYYEPAAIPSAASPQATTSPYSTSPGNTRFPNGHSSSEEHGAFAERFYERNNSRVVDGEFIRRSSGYHDTNRGRNRDRGFRNAPYNVIMDRGSHRTLNNAWSYESGGGSGGGTSAGSRYNSQNETGYATATAAASATTATPAATAVAPPTDGGGGGERRGTSDQSTKKKTKSKSGSRTPSPSGSTSSRSPSRSRSRSSSSSSSSSTSRTSSTSSPKSRRTAANSHLAHSDDRRPLAICVKNLPLRSSDTSLKDGLYHEYKKHGKVTSVKVVGQNSERHAIVCFKKPEDVEKALEVSYDKLFFGCKIDVALYQGFDVDDNDLRPYEAEIDEFHPKATRTLFIGNLEKDITASDLRKHFDQFGEIIEIDIKNQGNVSLYAFCQYSDIVSVVKAIRKMDGEHLGNNRIKLGFGKSMPTNVVWVDGIVETVNEKYLRMQFEPFGPISKISIDRDRGQALIFYEQMVGAQSAVSKMRGYTLKGNKIQVDFASRECQQSFYEHLEKQGAVVVDRGDERRDSTSRSFDSNRFARYDTPTRPRTSSYSSRSSIAASQITSAIPSPGTPGSVTPRCTSSKSRIGRFEYYEGGEITDRHFRSYDEYSQGSAASQDDPYDPDYSYNNHDSPSHIDILETRSLQSVSTVEHGTVPYGPPDIRNLQKERVHLLEQLEDCASSGDEHITSKKRLKIDLLDNAIGTDVIIEANRDHRKVMEVRRLSDVSLKHHSRRPSVDSKHARDVAHERSTYTPHSICKRRKTGGSDSGNKSHHYDHSGSESVGGSRPGTPLCDERPENFPPSEPRRVPRERDGPLTLPLPRFASQVMGRGSVSVAGIKGQKDCVLSSPPPAVTSPRISNPKPSSPIHVPPPASPPPRPPSLSSNSSDSDIPPSPSLDERIKSLDEKYEKWSGSRALSAAGGDALAKLDATREKFHLRPKWMEFDLKEVQPSEIVKSVMAKRSVFDEDLKRLENIGEKYEPKEFSLFPRTTVGVPVPTTTPATVVPAAMKINSPNIQIPKTPTMLSPRSTGNNMIPAKGLQYPFPSHPPIQPATSAILPQTPPATPTLVAPTIQTQTGSTTTRSTTLGDSRLKPCASASSDNRISSKVNLNRTVVLNTVTTSSKPCEKTSGNIPSEVGVTITANTNLNSESKCTRVKHSDKTMCKRDSNNPRGDVKSRRNSDVGPRRTDDLEKFGDTSLENEQICERAKSEERRKYQQQKEVKRLENEKLPTEVPEHPQTEQDQQETQHAKQESEKELEKERQAKAREQERQEKERMEHEKRELEREEQERRERQRREKEEEEQRQQQEKLLRAELEQQQKEREEAERNEREIKEKLAEEERQAKRERQEIEKQEREARKAEEKKHRDEQHDRKIDEHKHRENHGVTKNRDVSEKCHPNSEHKHIRQSSKEEKEKAIHEIFKKADSHDKNNAILEKIKHPIDKENEIRRKDHIKENRDNNTHDKHKNNDFRETDVRHNMPIDIDRSKIDVNKRKESYNNLPASIGTKRRVSSQDSLESISESKKPKLHSEYKKISDRRDSKDSSRSEVKCKVKNNSKSVEDKSVDKSSYSKDSEEKKKDKDRDDKYKSKQKCEKQKFKSKSREKESRESPSATPKELSDKDFLAKLELRSTEEMDKHKEQRRDSKEKRKQDAHEIELDKQSEEKNKRDRTIDKSKSREEQVIRITDEKRSQKKDRIRKPTLNSSDNNTDSDEPRKHSIFDIVDDEPAYISMYDKVKARSCKNMQKQEEEKRQEKIKAKFSQLKQSRAKREEKKRSTSWDEDSDSDKERHDKNDPKNRKNKMLIASSDDEFSDIGKSHKKREIFTDSDSDRHRRHKHEHFVASDEEFVRQKSHNKTSRLTNDLLEDDFKNIPLVKLEPLSDLEIGHSSDHEMKTFKVKDEFRKSLKKDRKTIKLEDSFEKLESLDTKAPLSEIKTEKANIRHSYIDNSSADESTELKKEKSKKHKKKLKRLKHSISSEDSTKFDLVESSQNELSDKGKHHERKRQHSKKDKKRDKSKDRDKSKKSKRSKSATKNDFKHDGKMENIFGSLSDSSDNGLRDSELVESKVNTFLEGFNDENIPSKFSNSDMEKSCKMEEVDAKELHRKRKERRRKEKERRLQEAAAAAALAEAADHFNENSMDFADMGKQLEANIKDEPADLSDANTDRNEPNPETDDIFNYYDNTIYQDYKKEDKKEGREKKKKRKKSKEERQKHHHHEKNKIKSENKKELLTPPDEPSKQFVHECKSNQSLPNLLDIPSPPQEKPSSDLSPSNSTLKMKDTIKSPIPPQINAIQPCPPPTKEKKRDKFIPGFGSEIDEAVHENAVKSISEFDTIKLECPKVEEIKLEKSEEPSEEKPRVVISQEETEDAVAALLGESFSNEFEKRYDEDISNANDSTATLVEEPIVQDDEEMRQAVQSLGATDLEVKPDTPQSEHELQIDTDSEEPDDISVRFDQQPKTPDMSELLHPPKTPDIATCFRSDDSKTTSIPLVIKPTLNIGSPPSLAPITPQSSVILNVKRNVDTILDTTNKLPPLALPSLVEPSRSVISHPWTSKADETVSKVESKLALVAKTSSSQLPNQLISSSSGIITNNPIRTYQSVVKLSEPPYPPLAAITKPEATPISIADQDIAVNTIPILQAATSSLHNLPARSPVQQNAPSNLSQDVSTGHTKITTATSKIRLPITPVMVSKPIRATAVNLPQAKVAFPSEPPKLIPTQEPRPRMIFHNANVPPPFPFNSTQKMVVQTNIPVARGLLMPAKPVHFNYMPPEKVVEAPKPSVPTSIALSQNSPPRVIQMKSKPIISPNSHITPGTCFVNNQKVIKPLISESPPSLVAISSLPDCPSIIQPSTGQPKHTPSIIQKVQDLKQDVCELKEVTTPSKPLDDIALKSKSCESHTELLTESVIKKEENYDNVVPEVEHKQLAIEKVTEELNQTLKKEIDSEFAVEASELCKPKEEPSLKDDVKNSETMMSENIVGPDSKDIKLPKLEDQPNEMKSQLEKLEGQKSDTEGVLSDTSRNSPCTDLPIKDLLDNKEDKEDSDYWSSKDVNIDSVIKTLCSADELSNHSNDNSNCKTECHKEEEEVKCLIEQNAEPDTVIKDDICKPEVDNSKSDNDVTNDDVEENNDKDTTSGVSTRRAVRGRGRKGRGGIERVGVQTRRGKGVIKTATTPTKRGGTRGGKVKIDRKPTKSESDTATDIYEFREDEENRPRLILTIKQSNSHSPAVQSAVVKEVPKEVVTPPTPQLPTPKTTELKDKPEDLNQPTSNANTRKSKRLQEKDISRTTVDDTIEDVVKNVVTRSNAQSTRRLTRQSTPAAKSTPDTPRKSPRGRKIGRRGSEATEESDDKDKAKPVEDVTTAQEDIKPEVEIDAHKNNLPTLDAPPIENEEPNAISGQENAVKSSIGLKAAVLRRVKGEMGQEPMTLIDPVTGLLTPMRECEENKYIPVPGEKKVNTNVIITQPQPDMQPTDRPAQKTVITTQQSPTVAPGVQPKNQLKLQSLKAHVLSSQAAQALVTQQLPVAPKQNAVIVNTNAPTVIGSDNKLNIPVSQNLNVCVSMSNHVPSHVSPRISISVSSSSPKSITVKQPMSSPSQMFNIISQNKQLLQITKASTTSVVPKGIVTPIIRHQQQPITKQQIISKGPLSKSTPHPVHMSGMPNPMLGKATQPLVPGGNRLVPGKNPLESPKVDVSLSNIMAVRGLSSLSPQGQPRHITLHTTQTSSMPVPGYEASLAETIPHFPPGSVTLRAPHDLPPPHYMHPSHVMYHPYLRQSYHFPRSSVLPGTVEKSGDGQEGEEAPVTSPPLELRIQGSVGLPMSSRSAVVPHSVQSPHDRATDSPQVGQVYNMQTARMQHYNPSRYYDSPTEPPPAHRPVTSHSSLAALGSDRPPMSHMGSLGTPDRPLGSHLPPDRPLGSHIPSERSLGAHLPPDRPISAHSALPGHLPLGTPERPSSSHLPPERPLSSHLTPDRLSGHSTPDRPVSAHGMSLGAGLGAAGNLMGAVARHIGVDAPTSQRGLQAATPPHASQVPPQAESLLMLLKQYPLMWQGLLALKNDQAAVQMYFVSGNDDVAKCSLPKNIDGSTPPLRIFQRMRLEPPQVEGVARKMQMEKEHCMLLALPCGHDHMDVLKQSTNLTSGFITYLQEKQAAGIINVAAPGTTQPPAYVVHIFPSCNFVNENLRRIAPSLLERVADIAHLLIVITTV